MPENSPIFISSPTMAILKKVIVSHDSTIKPNVEYFFNKRGAIYDNLESDEGDEEIYIDCQPTGSSGEPIPVPSSSKTPDKPPLDFSNPIVIIILGIIGGILLILMISVIVQFIRARRTPSTTPSSGGD